MTHRVMLRRLEYDSGKITCEGHLENCTHYVTGYNPSPQRSECWAEWMCTNCASRLCPNTFVSVRKDQDGRNSLMPYNR
ncbi:MAG: hypothetical protein ACR2GW_07100 [Pyrinomonadaceae bacterium]